MSEEGTQRITMDLAERRRVEFQLRRGRDAAGDDHVKQAIAASAADAEYLRVKSVTYLECRDKSMTCGGAQIVSNAAASEAKQRRDVAAALAKSALLKVAAADRDLVSVRDIHATSERIDGLHV